MIKLRLSLPCTANSLYRAILRGNYAVQVLSGRARKRRKLLVAEIHEQLGGQPEPLRGPVQITYVITPANRRTPDCDAYEKHLLDCLQHAGVLKDDQQVVQVSKERLSVAEFPGHIDVEIWEVGQ